MKNKKFSMEDIYKITSSPLTPKEICKVTIKRRRQKVMKLARVFMETDGFQQSEAVRLAWMLVKLWLGMYNGTVHFTFRKTNGEVREAWGTRLSSRIGDSEKLEKAEQEMKKKKKKKNDTVVIYYDTEKNEFRCFKKANLLTVYSS